MLGTAGRSAGLDLLRVVACLLVVAFHLRTVVGLDFGPLNFVAQGGDTGVYVFFALSGYLLYRPFVRGDVDLSSYAIKRTARILPGYLVALACLALLTRSPLPAHNPLPYLSMTATYNVELRGFLGNAWTLSAELIFYCLLPVIARVVAGAEIARLSVLALASVVASLLYWSLYGPGNAWIFGAFPFVLYTFVPGMLLAVVEVRDPGLFRRLGTWPLGLLGVVFVVLQTQLHGFPVIVSSGIGTALLIAWLANVRVPGARALAFAGGASYALYLWHKDLFLAFGPLGLLIAVAGAAASWAFVERPILELAHGIARRKHLPIAAEVPVPASTT